MTREREDALISADEDDSVRGTMQSGSFFYLAVSFPPVAPL